jgi:hypothetical protein
MDRVEEPLSIRSGNDSRPSAKKPASKQPVVEDVETIFHQDWMMEAASLGRWDKVEVRRNGNVVASLPFVIGSMQTCGVCSGYGRSLAHGTRVSWWRNWCGG